MTQLLSTSSAEGLCFAVTGIAPVGNFKLRGESPEYTRSQPTVLRNNRSPVSPEQQQQQQQQQ